MTRRNLFQIAAGAVGALFFPRTAASAPESVVAAPAAVAGTVGTGEVSDATWEVYLQMSREMGRAAAQMRDAEIFAVLGG